LNYDLRVTWHKDQNLKNTKTCRSYSIVYRPHFSPMLILSHPHPFLPVLIDNGLRAPSDMLSFIQLLW